MKKHSVLFFSLFLFSCTAAQTLTSAPLTQTSFTNLTSSPVVTADTTQPDVKTETPDYFESPMPTPTLRANMPMLQGQLLNITWVQMTADQTGWGIDSEGHILKTSDGGNAWVDVTPPLGEYEPQAFFALDSQTAWATFSQGPNYGLQAAIPETAFVWHTTDGGANWQAGQIFSLRLDSEGGDVPGEYYQPIQMQFVDSQTGWLLVDVLTRMMSMRPLLFRTEDSGNTWNVINDHYHDLDAAVAVGFAFTDKLTGWFGQNFISLQFGQYKIDDVVATGSWQTVKTMDGGITMEEFTLLPLTDEIKQSEYVGQIADCGETRMLSIVPKVVGIEWTCVLYNDELSKPIRSLTLTSDGGETWQTFSATGNEFFLDASHGWRLAPPGNLQQTVNGGTTWTTIKSVAWKNAQFDFVNAIIGWAVVSNDTETAFVHTTDGGKIWQALKPMIQ